MKRGWIVLVGFLTVSTFFLWKEHRAHILGALPWALLLLCPLLHLFLHRGHGGHGGHGSHAGHEDAGGRTDHPGEAGGTGEGR